jgi:hypothetical protein
MSKSPSGGRKWRYSPDTRINRLPCRCDRAIRSTWYSTILRGFFFSFHFFLLLFLPLHLFFLPLFHPSWELRAVQGILPQVPAFALIRPALIASPSNAPIIPRIQSFECKCLTGASVQREGEKKGTNTEEEHNPLTRDQSPINYLLEEHYMHPQIFNYPLDSTEFRQARFVRSSN